MTATSITKGHAHRVTSHRPLIAALVAALCAGAPLLATAANDEIIAFDGFEGCAPASALIGAEGGQLRHCGATLTVPAGAVSAPMLFGIEPLADPPDAPFDMELAGPAYRFTPDDIAFDLPLSLRVPREDARRGGLSVRVASGELMLIEACGHSAGGLQQFVDALGTFAAIRYVGELPASTQGLGDGEVISTVQGITHAHDLDDPGNNWAIFQPLPDGRRQVSMSAMKELDDGIEFVRLDFIVDDASGTGGLQQISVIGSHSGSYIAGLLGQATLTLGDLADGRVRGHIEATLASGPNSVPFEATFDLGVERYYFAPELSCPGGPPG